MPNVLHRTKKAMTGKGEHLFGKCEGCHTEVEALPAEVIASPASDGTNVVRCPDCGKLVTVTSFRLLPEAQQRHYLGRVLGVK